MPRRRLDPQVLLVLFFLVVIMLVMSFVSPHFLTFLNLFNVLRQAVFTMILAFGLTFVISSGGIDLSGGSLIGLCGGTTAWLLFKDANIAIALAAGLAAGLLAGVANGVIITKLRVPPFIATLAIRSMASGVLYVWTGAIPFREYMKDGFDFIGQGSVVGIPFPVVTAVVLLCLLLLMFRQLRFGRRARAIGSSEQATWLSGIKVDRVRIQIYALAGVLAAVSGIMLASRLTTVHPEMGKGYEFEAIAAVLIGGTPLSGGNGSLLGTALGALLLYLIKNAMNQLEVHPYWETIVIGLLILLTVSFERLRRAPRS